MTRNELCQLAVRETESVYRLADRVTRATGVSAESLVRETYAMALQIPEQVPLDEKGVRLWLYSVLHAVLRARLAQSNDSTLKQERILRASADAAGKILSWYRLSNDEWDRVNERLGRAIDELPWRHRFVFLLWSSEVLSIRQIATIVDAKESIVRNCLLRATMAVATQLGEVATGWLAEPAPAGATV